MATPSIAMIPSGYKDGKVYSVLPNSSDGDFDFTRGSAATRVNAQGLVENVHILGSNLVVNGDFATDSDWGLQTGWSISGGSLNAVNTNGIAFQSNLGLVIGKTYKVSLNTSNYVSGSARLKLGSSAYQNISTTDSFQEFYFIPTSNSDNIIFSYLSTFTGSIDNVSVKEIADDTNLPRIDYSDGSCPSLLLEPQSTNLIPYSEDFSQWTDVGTLTKTENYSLSPSGEVNATRLQWSSGTNFTFQSLSHVGSDFTISIYMKSNTGVSQYVKLFMDNNSQGQDRLVTTEWQRFEFTNTTTPTQSNRNAGLISSNSQVGDLDISIWGAQFENLPHATSYIPTNGSIATRLADVANNSGSASLINSTEGVLYAEIAALSNNENTNRSIAISNSSYDNRLELRYRNNGTQILTQLISSNTTYFNAVYTPPEITDFNKIAIKYKQDDFALWVNGVEVATDTSGNTPIGLNKLAFNDGGGTLNFYGNIKALAVYKEALTDAELQELTTI